MLKVKNKFVEHAKMELDKIRGGRKPQGREISSEEKVMKLVKLFSKQEFDIGELGYVTSVVTKLIKQYPLSPLTGEDDEWERYSSTTFLNKRCMDVYKSGGKAYFTKGKLFSTDEGKSWFSTKESVVEIESFPYRVPESMRIFTTDAEVDGVNEVIGAADDK